VYNLLNTPKKGESAIYATSLGYTPTSEFLTIGDVFKDNVTGPVTVKAGTIATLGINAKRVYKDGESVALSDIESFDVIYYSKSNGTIWAYSRKISGIINEISPNKEAPTSVTVSGVTYPLTYYAAQRAFGLDGLENGQTVTMLLDKNGKVCDAYKASELYESLIGVMTGVSSKTITASDGTKTTGYYASILTLDRSTVDIEQSTNSDSYVGKAVSVDMQTGRIRTHASGGSISGYVNYGAHLIGQTPIANNLKVIEIDDNGNRNYPTLSRLDGVNISSQSVLLASKNASGAIDGLILSDVTGDMHKYGVITALSNTTSVSPDGTTSKGATLYSYDLGGIRGTVSFPRTTISLTAGPCVFIYKEGELVDAKNLTRADNVSVLTPEYATLSNGVKHKLSPNVLVYKVSGDDKILTTLDEALTYDGTLWVYYDDIQSAGGLVRVIYIK